MKWHSSLPRIAQFGWATADNAPANDKAVRHLAEAFSGSGSSKLDAKQIRIRHVPRSDLLVGYIDAHLRLCRCMAHSLNLAAKRVLEAFAPTPHHVLAKRKGARAAKPADVDQDEINGDEEQEENGELDENELVNFKSSDLLGKAHAFVTQACPHSKRLLCHVVSDSSHSQVRLSPQARAFFSEQCLAAKVPQLELLKWCRTRWSSASDMIERLLQLRPVCATLLSWVFHTSTPTNYLF